MNHGHFLGLIAFANCFVACTSCHVGDHRNFPAKNPANNVSVGLPKAPNGQIGSAFSGDNLEGESSQPESLPLPEDMFGEIRDIDKDRDPFEKRSVCKPSP